MQNDIPEKAHAFQCVVGLVDPAPLTASTTKFAKRNRSFPRLNRKISTRDIEHGNDQREKGLNGGEHCQAAGIAGKTPMGKWAFIIEPLLRGLESEIADRQGLIRSNIDNKIRETEQIVSEIEPQDFNERPEDRVAEFLRELRRTLRQRLEQEPQNKIWYEAVLLLDIPRIRIKR
jgi:hypothetical protein